MHGIAIAILSVHPSVTCVLWKWNNRLSISQHHTKQGYDISSLSTPTGIVGNVPFHPKYLPKVTHPLRKTQTSADFFFSLSLTMGFPTSYRWSAHVTHKSAKGGSKSDFYFFIFWIKITWIVCYKVSLCENFQRQTCSTTIPVANGPDISTNSNPST